MISTTALPGFIKNIFVIPAPCTLTKICTPAIYRIVEGTSKCSKVTFSIEERTCCVRRINVCTSCKLDIDLIPVSAPTARTAYATLKPVSLRDSENSSINNKSFAFKA